MAGLCGLLEPAAELTMIDGAGLAEDALASGKDHEVWDALYAETSRKFGMAIAVDFEHEGAPGEFLGHALHFGRNQATRPTPSRPEIHENRDARAAGDLVELRRAHVEWRRNRSELRLAAAAAAAVRQMARGNAIIRATGGTGSNHAG